MTCELNIIARGRRLTVGAILLVCQFSIIISHFSVCKAQHDLSQRQVYMQAEANYEIGRIEQARDSLLAHLGSMKGANRQNALRLVALSYLARFDIEQTERYASQLLQENPYYTPTAQDPATFVDVINKIKGGLTATITTASSIKESLEEAPVPITIITAEMIENLGYNKRLGQILATYVPGMSEIYNNTFDNMSMHGAYSKVQELILVMENGHRLNNRYDNSYAMDYSVSTDKIDHIEVLRGPASSLYGNVALSAVVNIITKSGRLLNGVKMKYGHGAFGTHRADISLGTTFMDADIFVWGALYLSDGQRRTARDSVEYADKFNFPMEPGHYAYVDGYKGTPSYDIGMTLKYKGFSLMATRKNSKKLAQYAYDGYYDYDKYRAINSSYPGYGEVTSALELGYSAQVGPVALNASVSGDWHKLVEYDAASPEFNDTTKYNIYVPRGAYTYNKTEDHTLGGRLQASTAYTVGSMSGNVLAGVQFEHFTLTDNIYSHGSDYTGIFEEFEQLKSMEHHENSWSFYAQAKHHFLPMLILNAGLRYDIRYRFAADNITYLSPRLALIYTPHEALNLKLSYARAFVDVSFWERYRMDLLQQEFLSQYLTALQLTAMGKIAPLHLNYDVNLFYNQYENLHIEDMNHLDNKGLLRNIGIEATATYSHNRLTAGVNAYWRKTLKAENYFYSEEEHTVYAVPDWTVSLQAGWKLLKQGRHELKLYGNAKYMGSKLLMQTKFIIDGYDIRIETSESRLGKAFVMDAGLKYTYADRLTLALDCENLFDTDHFLSGPDYTMYPNYERGRNLIVSASYSF